MGAFMLAFSTTVEYSWSMGATASVVFANAALSVLALLVPELRYSLAELEKLSLRKVMRNTLGELDISLANSPQSARLTKELAGFQSRAAHLGMFGVDDDIHEVEMQLRKSVLATEISVAELFERLDCYGNEHLRGRRTVVDREAVEELFKTVQVCSTTLQRERGGALVVIGHAVALNAFKWRYRCDNGSLLRLFKSKCPNIVEHSDNFAWILHCLSALHSADDRWGWEELFELARGLGYSDKEQQLRDLKGQPMDGAILIDHHGNVVDAAVKLTYEQSHFYFQRPDPLDPSKHYDVGTRHSGALNAAVCFGRQSLLGVVFVRSDSEGLTCFFGGSPSGPPQALLLATRNRRHGRRRSDSSIAVTFSE